ncbi:MAG: stage II sporulation protein M [Steroidobacteraceae bacterium]
MPANPDNRDAAAWMRARAPLWRRLAAEAGEASGRSRASAEEALATMEAYRTLARDLASARELLPGSAASAALESAYAAVHAAIGRAPHVGGARWLALLREDIPAAAAMVRTTALWIALLMVLSALAGWWLITTYPELVGLIASERMIDGVEHGHLWTDQLLDVAPASLLSARIFSNNVVVTAGAFCAGLFFGLGTFYMIALNGLMLGGLLAFTHQHGLGLELLKFTFAHGPVELSVICLAGAAGTKLAEAVIRPAAATRAESLRRAAARLGPLLVACALLLLGSGLIEGFVSADPHVSIPVRLAVGLAYWVLMLLMLSGRLYARPAPARDGSSRAFPSMALAAARAIPARRRGG